MNRKTMHLKYLVVPVMALMASQLYAAEPAVLKTDKDKINYAIGVSMINTVKQQGGEVNLDLVIKGMMDGLTGENLLMTEDELRRILAARQSEITEKQKQAANQRDAARSTSADAGQNGEPEVPQKQDHPEQRDGFLSSSMLAKEEGQAKKTAPVVGTNGQIPPMQARMSVAESGQSRNERKLRALELRRRTIEQELQ